MVLLLIVAVVVVVVAIATPNVFGFPLRGLLERSRTI